MSPGFRISPLTPDFRSNYEAAELQRRPIWTAVGGNRLNRVASWRLT
jgi:hypothetical protein